MSEIVATIIPIQFINLGRCFMTGMATRVAKMELVEMMIPTLAKSRLFIATTYV
jgi:hypothetical protein